MNDQILSINLAALKTEFDRELLSIADWWVANTIDREQGGFYGEVDTSNNPVKQANKGIILNARILWFFSEASRATVGTANSQIYRDCATRAFNYIVEYFFDKQHGGVYWEVDAAGGPVNTRKQVYAQAFTIYALCAYYQLTKNQQALDHALSCFELLEAKAVDRKDNGYLEAFARDWSPIEDMRLSTLDLNYPKSQNTHLHVMEAYTTLHQVHPTPVTSAALRYNIDMFDRYMINRDNHHLRMFMDMQWNDFSPGFTYGHDIEAVWLIAKALASLGDKAYESELMPTLVRIAEITLEEAVDDNGQLLNSYNFESKSVDTSSHWWVQAEALVGFLFAYAETHDERYFSAANGIWQFIKQHQIDQVNGEWFWLADNAKTAGEEHYKVGFWKCPYHNGRAMMEASRYLHQLETQLA